MLMIVDLQEIKIDQVIQKVKYYIYIYSGLS